MTDALYRHYDKDNTLLYIGVSLNAVNRLSQHRTHSGWFSEISRVTIERFADRAAALDAETAAIQNEKPKYNVQKVSKLPPPPSLKQSPEALVENDRILRSIVLRPAYTTKEVAVLLGMRNVDVERLIESKKLGSFEAPPKRPSKPTTTYVSGWQIIHFLESMNALSPPKRKTA